MSKPDSSPLSPDEKEDGSTTSRPIVYDHNTDYTKSIYKNVTHAILPLRGGNTIAHKGVRLFLSALPSIQHLKINVDLSCMNSEFPNLEYKAVLQDIFPQILSIEVNDDFEDEIVRHVSFRHDTFPNLQILMRTYDPKCTLPGQADSLCTCACTEKDKTKCRFTVIRRRQSLQ